MNIVLTFSVNFTGVSSFAMSHFCLRIVHLIMCLGVNVFDLSYLQFIELLGYID